MSDSAALSEIAQAHADFHVLLPRRLPRGYRLADVLRVPGLGSALTLQYHGPRQRTWTLTQRLSMLSFDDELAATSEGWQILHRRGRRFAYAASSWHGEPVERHRTPTRQTLWWEQDGTSLELERVVGFGPSWRRLWPVVDSLA